MTIKSPKAKLAAGFILVTVSTAVVFGTHESAHSATHETAHSASTVNSGPPLITSGTATTSVETTTDVMFSPPDSPSRAMSAQSAVDDAWQAHAVPGATDSRAILAHAVQTGAGVDADAWLIIFDGTCVPIGGPAHVPGTLTNTGPKCWNEPVSVAVDAQTGAFLFAFDGGSSPDPTTILHPTDSLDPTRS